MSISTDRAARELQHTIIEAAKASFKGHPDGLTFVQHLEVAATAELKGGDGSYTYQVYAVRTGWTLEIHEARAAQPEEGWGLI